MPPSLASSHSRDSASTPSAYVCIRQHTSAYVSIREDAERAGEGAERRQTASETAPETATETEPETATETAMRPQRRAKRNEKGAVKTQLKRSTSLAGTVVITGCCCALRSSVRDAQQKKKIKAQQHLNH